MNTGTRGNKDRSVVTVVGPFRARLTTYDRQSHYDGGTMNTRTIAILALVVAVIVVLILVL
jgi:hypothetical protein